MLRTLGYGILVSLAVTLAACGGGDEEKNLDKFLNSELGGSSDSSSDTARMALTLLDCTEIADDLAKSPTNCPTTVNVSLSHPGTAHIQLTDLNNKPLANKLVQLTTDIATLSPTSGRQLTDENGEAVFTVYAKPEADASKLTATAAELGLSDSLSFAVSEPGLSMNLESSLEPGASLAADSTLSITAHITQTDGTPYTSPVTIHFSSVCDDNGLAQLSDSVTTVNGIATAVYKPTSCQGEDTIVATPELSALESRSLNISIATTTPAAIQFVDASSQVIYLPESIGPTFSIVRFQVLDNVGQPLSGQQVDFALAAPLYGLTFSPATDISDSGGYVETKIFSGNMPGVIVVEASMPSPADNSVVISGVSNALAVHTGMADSDSFSLSLSQHAIEAWSYDGVEVDANIIMGDENNNWVPDGTTVYFRTESGIVQGECQTINSRCTAKWLSGGERPSVGIGRSTLLAVTVGQEAFDDANSNYHRDSGETYFGPTGTTAWYGEAWLDEDEDGIHDTGSEYFRDYNMNNEFDSATGIHNNSIPAAEVEERFNSLLCYRAEEAEDLCSRDLVELFDSEVIVWSTSGADINFGTITAASAAVTVRDLNGNQMAAGTTVEFEVDHGEIIGDSSVVIPDGIGFGHTYTVRIDPELDGEDIPIPATLYVKVTSPRGIITPASIALTN